MLNANPQPVAALDLRRALIRAAAIAVSERAPLEVIDPRGMIFDRTPAGEWTLRVRGSDRQMVLGLGSGPRPWTRPEELSWTSYHLEEDEALPGRALLTDPLALAKLVELGGPLEQSLSTYRHGRRAVVRVSPVGGRKARYVKLLSRKAFRRASRALSIAADLELDGVLTPWKRSEELGALVFDEISDPALHDRLWAGEHVDWESVLNGVSDLARGEAHPRLRRRDEETERQSAVRLLTTGIGFLPSLEPLLRRVEVVRLPRLDGEGLLHGDLHDKQLFLCPDRIRFIDAEGLGVGDRRIDLVNLGEHVHLRALQGCEAADEAAAAFWNAAGLDPEASDIRLLRGLVRARLAGVYARRPWWWGVATSLAEDALRLLRGVR